MDNQSNNNFEIIKTANKEMLDYFNTKFLDSLETIQELKTQAFEIDIKIDELEKTKDIYAFKSTSRKSVFTPIINDSMENERGKIIEEQIKGLEEVRETLNTKIRSLEASLNVIRNRLSVLTEAEEAITTISSRYADAKYDTDTSGDTEGFVFVEKEPEAPNSHGYNILMQDAFDKAYLSTLMDKHIKDGIVSINHKLDMLSYLFGTDISRARLTLQEILLGTRRILDSADDICNKLDYHLDSARPVLSCLDDFVMVQRDSHPECIIDTDIECTDYELNLHPVFTINLFKLLNIFFDNIFKHSNANRISFRMSISPNVVDACIDDNGIGINRDYLTQSPWYSSLHKAHEIIYLLNGKLTISGDIIQGTRIQFSFPIQL